MFYLAINRVQSGPFAENEVRQRAARGEFGPTDLCWCEGWPQWRRISEVFPPAAVEPPRLSDTPPVLPGAAAAVPPVRAAAGPATSGTAVMSLVCGLGVIVLFPFFFLLAPAAVICGHVAKARIKRSGGRLAGGGLATAGLLCGYIGGSVLLALTGTISFFIVREVRHNTEEVAVRTQLEQFWTAADSHLRTTEVPEVAYAELVGEGKALSAAEFAPVAGEDYRNLVVKRGDDWLSITLGDGRTVSYYASGSAAGETVSASSEYEEEVEAEDEAGAGRPAEAEAESSASAEDPELVPQAVEPAPGAS